MAGLIQSTNEAGVFKIPALGQTVKLVEWREDDFYDTVNQPAGAVAAGTNLELFRDLTNKNLQHTNITTTRRIPSGSEMVMNRVGIYIGQCVGNVPTTGVDVVKVAHAASFTFILNTMRIIAQGPLYKFQTGYGMTGSTTETTVAYLTTGVPSAAAAPQLLVAQPIKDDDDLMGTIRFDGASWITAFVMPTLASVPGVNMTAYLHGLIKRPQGK